MLITKSLFVTFTKSPKLARWQVNDKQTYGQIQESLYGWIDGVKICNQVEEIVKQHYKDYQIAEVDTKNMWNARHQTYHDRTIQLLAKDPEIVYQPAFLVDGVFIKCDFLKKSQLWTYDLIEVKSKNMIRKTTKAQPLLDDLVADISIQAWVLQKVLWDQFSWQCFLAHTNKVYQKQWVIDPQALIVFEKVTNEYLDNETIVIQLKQMQDMLGLPQERFNDQYPYNGTDYLTYFWTVPPKDSLWSISRLWSKKKSTLYHAWIHKLAQFTSKEIDLIKNSKWEETRSSRFVELWKQWMTVVDKKWLSEMLWSLQYPLYFYDYETISNPVPLFDGTSPWQQVVVQYSLHVVYEDGSISHHEAIINPWERSNKRLLESMIQDMNQIGEWTRIVWYAWFENKRNEERSLLFPEYEEELIRINNQTFDLMSIFEEQIYFDRRFEWSCSIKNVLPVLTDISYEDLEVSNGGQAMQELTILYEWWYQWNDYEQMRKHLLEYCKMDTWAMVRIWQELRKLL